MERETDRDREREKEIDGGKGIIEVVNLVVSACK